MALIRLAGAGLKGLMGVGAKKGTKTLMQHAAGFGTGLAADAAILGGGGALVTGGYDALTGGGGLSETERRIIQQGPDIRTGQYNIGLGDRVQSEVSKLFGKKGISQEGLKELDDLTKFKAITDDPKLKAYARKKGINLDDYKGQTLNEVNAILGPDMAKDEALTLAKLKDDIYKGSTQYADAQAAKRKEGRRYDQTRLDNLTRENIAREDRLSADQRALDLNMANLAFKKGESERDFKLREQQINREFAADRRERTAQALAGLAQLPLLFAI